MESKDNQKFLEEAYNKGGFFCDFTNVYQACFSSSQNAFYYIEVAKKFLAPNLAKRGRLSFLSAADVERWYKKQYII